ncbi:ATP-binding protein [Methanocella sp. CWC-04]|uniref:Iron-sulfur cluster carrier protein n=1 Tax=Methanooceanicella nereidis TaxID=2052831 RepID=A0AAP2RCY6_9EURY|nr:Mrp/NBP35 family ATP-binding protein [Methanocella sp. CWC-04]MCD1295261.1 ATP-binding protein [Methanocella sp. CWC-04]
MAETSGKTACDTCASKGSDACDTCKDKVNLEQQEQKIRIAKNLSAIKYRIAIVSGKGGVGKSTVTAGIALSLAKKGYRVGVLDADISGPNMPHLLNVEGIRMGADVNGLIPIEAVHGIKVVSVESLISSSDSPVIWRGPMRSSIINQFLADVQWGELDFMLIDLPPGTGDEPLSIMQTIPLNGLVIVSTSSNLSVLDVSKIINMAKMLETKILGIVENMAYIECPDCGKRIYPFGEDTVKDLAGKYGIGSLGSIPMDVKNRGTDILTNEEPSLIIKNTNEIAENIVRSIEG